LPVAGIVVNQWWQLIRRFVILKYLWLLVFAAFGCLEASAMSNVGAEVSFVLSWVYRPYFVRAYAKGRRRAGVCREMLPVTVLLIFG